MSGSNCPRGTETSGTCLRKLQNSKRQNSFCGETGRWWIVEVTGRSCVAHSRSRIYVAVSRQLETPAESCPSGLEVRKLCWCSGAIRFESCSNLDYCHNCSECWENCQSRFKINIFCVNFFSPLTLILLTWRIWWAPNNASKWQMGFNSAFNVLIIRSRV
jgi:hypothetical protein